MAQSGSSMTPSTDTAAGMLAVAGTTAHEKYKHFEWPHPESCPIRFEVFLQSVLGRPGKVKQR